MYIISNVLSPSISSVFPIFPWLPQRSNPMWLCQFSCSLYLTFILGTQAISTCMHMVGECVLNHYSFVRLFADLWTIVPQAPRSMGFSRQEHWNGLPCLPPGDFLDPGIEPGSPASSALADEFFTTSATLKVPISTYLYTAINSKWN